MDSQEDIFATQQPKKKVKYDHVVLCDKDENAEEPFSMYPTSMFSETEILGRWLDSILDSSSRLKTLLNLQKVHNKNLCLFGKVPAGIIITTTMHYLYVNSNYVVIFNIQIMHCRRF